MKNAQQYLTKGNTLLQFYQKRKHQRLLSTA